DGVVDLVMLDHEGYLAFWEGAERDGKRIVLPPRRAFVDQSGTPIRLSAGSAGKSGRRKLCAVDWDGDGMLDLLLNSANATFLQQIEKRGDMWVMQDRGPLAQRNIEGHDVSPTTVDFDGNGIPDFLGGAEDGRFYFLKNPRAP
ncbi:MAG: VCBS repeat-containing protein, partial [Chthoniobacteraceae bacterium]